MNVHDDQKHVLVCGDGCLNVILEIRGTLQRAANMDMKRRVLRPGGNALVTAMALARWGISVDYAGVIGADSDGDEILGWMKETGLGDSTLIRRGRTRTSYVLMDSEERTILDEREESSELRPEDWQHSRIAHAVADAGVVMVDRYCSSIHSRIIDEIQNRRAKGESAFLVYRTGSRPSEHLNTESDILRAADICLTKSAFLLQIGLNGDPTEACRRLCERFDVRIAVATLGKEGAAYCDVKTGETGIVPAPEVVGLKTFLGAGDFFRAGFLYSHLRGNTLLDCVRTGNSVATHHCQVAESEDPSTMFFSLGDVRG